VDAAGGASPQRFRRFRFFVVLVSSAIVKVKK
jgi:hypothetical protein